jgi:hypothetical protein
VILQRGSSSVIPARCRQATFRHISGNSNIHSHNSDSLVSHIVEARDLQRALFYYFTGSSPNKFRLSPQSVKRTGTNTYLFLFWHELNLLEPVRSFRRIHKYVIFMHKYQ